MGEWTEEYGWVKGSRQGEWGRRLLPNGVQQRSSLPSRLTSPEESVGMTSRLSSVTLSRIYTQHHQTRETVRESKHNTIKPGKQ